MKLVLWKPQWNAVYAYDAHIHDAYDDAAESLLNDANGWPIIDESK